MKSLLLPTYYKIINHQWILPENRDVPEVTEYNDWEVGTLGFVLVALDIEYWDADDGTFDANDVENALHDFDVRILSDKPLPELFCLRRRILERHMTQRKGRRRWETALWIVFTKHLRQTTRCPHGYVCILAFALQQMTHWNPQQLGVNMNEFLDV